MRPIDADELKAKYPKDEDWEYPVNSNASVCEDIDNAPTVDAIPISWIKERIENAINAKQTLIAQMWLELIDGYMREKNEQIRK